MKKRSKTVFITGGGTGGHVYPAVAIFEKLATVFGAKNIYYVGDPGKMDKDVAQEHNMNFLPVIVSALPRSVGSNMLVFLFELFVGVMTCISYINKYKPSLIIGTGGYVSAPALIAGVLLRVPIILHDSDAYPGVVTRKMSPYAKVVNLAFAEAKKYIKSKNITVYGNPVRTSLCSITKPEARAVLNLNPDKKTIFVMGGSQGAHSINEALKSIARELVEEEGLQIIHQTGAKKYEDYYLEMNGVWWENFEENGSYVVKPYFEDMSIPLNAADLVISRAGSLSISELNLCAIPSILIPYPHAAANHQYHNAMAMQKCSASVCIEDKNCTADNLKAIILDIIRDSVKLNQMSMANRKVSKPDAMNELFELIAQYLV